MCAFLAEGSGDEQQRLHAFNHPRLAPHRMSQLAPPHCQHTCLALLVPRAWPVAQCNPLRHSCAAPSHPPAAEKHKKTVKAVKLLKAKIEEDMASKAAIETEKEQLTAKLTEADKQNADLQAQLEQSRAEIAAAVAAATAASSSESQVAALQSQLAEVEAARASLEPQLSDQAAEFSAQELTLEEENMAEIQNRPVELEAEANAQLERGCAGARSTEWSG